MSEPDAPRAPDLMPIPFATLMARLRRELAAGGAVYHLPRKSWWTPDPARDLTFTHFGHRIDTPAGPASGPHTQLAQNLVLAWLAGARFFELKTVQVLDALDIPRPCIHAPHVGYNVEWSQELTVAQSAAEYAKGWWLIHRLAREGPWAGVGSVFDTSVGYDLAGIRSEKVRGFLATLRDAGPLLERLRAELPPDLAAWADVPMPARISDTITLSTFHGCPAHEIEAIARQTLEWGWHTVVKLNPTLLGHDAVRGLLDHMGYDFIRLRRGDFEKDLSWEQLRAFVPRLQALAAARGIGFGVKFSNTLVCTSPEPPFEQEEMYLSGPPLHALAFTLAARFRAAFPGVPITFSAGIDTRNFADVVRAGLGPVTSCTDLLKTRGYARMTGYLRGLERAMAEGGAATLDAFVAPASLAERASRVADDPTLHRAANATPPRKVGSHLLLLDCLTCDKCVPVCPNAANFTVDVPQGTHRPGAVTWTEEGFALTEGEPLVVARKHQIGNTAEACNLCGHCDTYCPEDGGPYLVKPTLFATREAFHAMPRDGFYVDDAGDTITWRRDGETLRYRRGVPARLEVDGGAVLLDGDTPVATEGVGALDLRDAVTLRLLLDAFTAPDACVWRP